MSGLRKRSVLINEEQSSERPFLKRVAAVDLFPKPREDYCRVQTYQGALVSLVTVTVIGLLVLWELGAYIAGRDAYKTELGVDTSLARETVFNIDITFPNVKCHDLSLDIMDATGAFKLNVSQSVHKIPVNAHGEVIFSGRQSTSGTTDAFPYDEVKNPASSKFCGNCFPESKYKHTMKDVKKCCNTCGDVMSMHDRHGMPRPQKSEVEQCIYELSLANPGCNYQGKLHLKKVGGMLLFAPKRREVGYVVWDVMRFDTSHIINHFSIGDQNVARFSRRGVHFPLNGHAFNTRKGFAEVRYFLRIVPTAYLSGRNLEASAPTYEYGVQWSHRFVSIGMGHVPIVGFSFDFTPIQVNNHFQRPPLYHFLVQLCGIVGGLFVVLGLVDRLVAQIVHYM